MNLSTDELIEAVLALPVEARIVVLERLLEVTPEDPPGLSIDDPDFLAELDRRSADSPENFLPIEELWRSTGHNNEPPER
jgi:hypothetical protein